MRRLLAVAAIVVSALAMTACANPPGVDGNLVNDWSAMAAPQGSAPVVGGCYALNAADMTGNPPVDCHEPHFIEVVHVGTFTGTDAARVTAPPLGSPSELKAYAACTSAAKAYLGADWHAGLVALSIVLPDENGWKGGARWYRCDVSTISSIEDGTPSTAVSSLKGKLATSKVNMLACVDWDDEKTYISNFRTASCTAKHAGEYAGAAVSSASTPYPSSDKAYERLADSGCEAQVAAFLGLSGTRITNYSVGWAYTYTSKTQWKMGNHAIRCYAAAYTHNKYFTQSVKGIGNRTPKG